MRQQLLQRLTSEARALGLVLSEETAQQLIDFLLLLQKWNAAYNLTAIRSLEKMLTHHLLDSLAVVPFLCGPRVLDVGSGAGFPGVPLAIVEPDRNFVLLDSNGKKVRFLLQVKSLFELVNVCCEQSRMESFRIERGFDVIICRAVGEIGKIIDATRHLLVTGGKWLFMKGQIPQSELDNISIPCVIHSLTIPGLDAQRHLIEVHDREVLHD